MSMPYIEYLVWPLILFTVCQSRFCFFFATSLHMAKVCNAGIHACAKAGQWTIALGLLEFSKQQRPGEFSF